MQTFLPYPDFSKSARALDCKRLGKQRVEARQILNTLQNGGGWRHHPAVKMWAGYEDALRAYYNACLKEWLARGYNNNLPLEIVPECYDLPPWYGNPAFHASHRSNLLRKDARYYDKFGWKESNDLPYWWPI